MRGEAQRSDILAGVLGVRAVMDMLKDHVENMNDVKRCLEDMVAYREEAPQASVASSQQMDILSNSPPQSPTEVEVRNDSRSESPSKRHSTILCPIAAHGAKQLPSLSASHGVYRHGRRGVSTPPRVHSREQQRSESC